MKLSFSQTDVSLCKAGVHKSCMTNFVWWHLIFLVSLLQFFPLCTKMCIISHVLCRKHQIPVRVTGHSRTVGLQFCPCFKSCFWPIEYTGSFHTFWKFVDPGSKELFLTGSWNFLKKIKKYLGNCWQLLRSNSKQGIYVWKMYILKAMLTKKKKNLSFSQWEHVNMLGKTALACMQNFVAITKAIP